MAALQDSCILQDHHFYDKNRQGTSAINLVDKILVLRLGSKYDQRGGYACLALLGTVTDSRGTLVQLRHRNLPEMRITPERQTQVQYTIHMQCTQYDDMSCLCILKRQAPRYTSKWGTIYKCAPTCIVLECSKVAPKVMAKRQYQTSGFSCMLMVPFDRFCSHDHFDISFVFFGVQMN